jgi:uncharacterized protein (TIGR02284 family)
MSEHIEALKSLHTALIDSRNGYEEALEDAEGKGLTPLFRDMIALRNRDADEIAGHLTALGQSVDEKGSFMSTVHRTVISVRSVITGLDESILPALIDGEERILEFYDEALAAASPRSAEHGMLIKQREALARKIGEMQRRSEQAA